MRGSHVFGHFIPAEVPFVKLQLFLFVFIALHIARFGSLEQAGMVKRVVVLISGSGA